MNRLKIIAVTHKQFDISDIGKFHIEESEWGDRLNSLKSFLGLDELMFLSTCTGFEFLISPRQQIDRRFIERFLLALYPSLPAAALAKAVESSLVFEGDSALNHLFRVAASLDSLVVGEREIITQVRNAYEFCRKLHLTGDMIRLAIQKSVEYAKKVYTMTNISRHPVSVVSLAYRRLKELNVNLDARFLFIGAGITNATMAKYLRKHGFVNFTVFNRTLANAEKLAADLNGTAHEISSLIRFNKGFDVIVTCTGSSGVIITKEIYAALVGEDTSRKIVIDLAVPNDLDPEITTNYDVNLIAVNNLQETARKNLQAREKELVACENILAGGIEEFRKEFKERQVELAMSNVPKKVKEIRQTAVNEVFARDLEKLDEPSKEVLDKIIAYLEKKYISVPMKMAKEILIEEISAK